MGHEKQRGQREDHGNSLELTLDILELMMKSKKRFFVISSSFEINTRYFRVDDMKSKKKS